MNEIQRYAGGLPANRAERRAQQRVRGVALATQEEQARLYAIASATQFGMFQYVQVKRLQSDLEHVCPDAAEGLAALANNALFEMTRSLQAFGQDIG
ncbi:hypothetical protein [Amycolatopsis sp. H20-H5]|uniref:hypothetical protein n=1 Tax=Amycolatopsis sp. H20-H5 TaxID=3046309 RepID=UPI002DB5C3C7|nr:hypothetical protein [Amycolatopsis sp. H20-H5]MEC3976226.1 hypothetical protein [Amycolatopsis sp. H20-H5]